MTGDRVDEKLGVLCERVRKAINGNVRARPDQSGTLLISVEVNLSQGGIGQTFITEQFRGQVKT